MRPCSEMYVVELEVEVAQTQAREEPSQHGSDEQKCSKWPSSLSLSSNTLPALLQHVWHHPLRPHLPRYLPRRQAPDGILPRGTRSVSPHSFLHLVEQHPLTLLRAAPTPLSPRQASRSSSPRPREVPRPSTPPRLEPPTPSRSRSTRTPRWRPSSPTPRCSPR
jgi:hypothetical protein